MKLVILSVLRIVYGENKYKSNFGCCWRVCVNITVSTADGVIETRHLKRFSLEEHTIVETGALSLGCTSKAAPHFESYEQLAHIRSPTEMQQSPKVWRNSMLHTALIRTEQMVHQPDRSNVYRCRCLIYFSYVSPSLNSRVFVRFCLP